MPAAESQKRGTARAGVKSYPFWLGGVSASIAVCFTHPLDLAKLRMQNSPQKSSTLRMLHTTLMNEGVRGLYIGLSASVMRQMTYSLTRFGAYDKLKTLMLRHDSGQVPVWKTIAAAGLAGAAGGIAGNPADVVLVRMTGDLYRSAGERFNYRGPINGLVRIMREEGSKTLFRGLSPNVVRAVLMNSSQLASYDFFKDLLRSTGYMTPGTLTHYLCSSLLAGTVATTICSPADVVRARVMNSRGGQSIPQLVYDAVRREGPTFLFRGWVPSWIRLAPQTVILLTVLEELRALVDWVRGT